MYARKMQKTLPTLAFCAGLAGLAVRLILNAFFRDQRGLIPQGHPLGLLLMALVLGSLVLAFLAARNMESLEGYQQSFPASLAGFLGHMLGAAGLLVTVITTQPAVQGNLLLAWKALGWASVPCLMLAGWFRFQGKAPFFGAHLCPALFLLFHAVGNYQTWSSDPQLLNYLIPLLAVVCMLLFAFYNCAFDAALEWRRKLTFFAYASIGLGLMAAAGSGFPWLYLGVGLWALMDRPVMRARRRRPRPFQEEAL